VQFNSFPFLFGFLPLALILTYGAGKRRDLAKLVLMLLSLGFYAWWRLDQLPILLWSIGFNFVVGDRVQRAFVAKRLGAMRAWLVLGLLADLALLGWFKYANFVVDNLDGALGLHIHLKKIPLPLAISFFTFQKIAYLIDSSRGEAQPMRFLDFSLFAAFFPQLISGPIVHYKEIVPQLKKATFGKLIGRNLMVGLVILAIGLFKKTVIADTLAGFANPLYDSVSKGGGLTLVPAWLAAMTFTLQLYFDFSGYSDMAIGLGRMFGVKLPLNFHSPLRAASIIDYWRRWHMTLQRFVLAYIFQPLSVPLTRIAASRGMTNWTTFLVAVALPSFVTFVVLGIWHGAGWTYVLFGVMHGVYICVNQAWRERRTQKRRALRKLKRTLPEPGRTQLLAYSALTLAAVMFANVMFRAHTPADAVTIWQGMTGLAGEGLAGSPVALGPGLAATLAISIAIVFLAPNTQQIMSRFDPAQNWREWRMQGKPPISWTWKPSTAGLLFAGLALFFGVVFVERGPAVFLYFNF
jgi:D-alanyl-lipoteichoic acid acyltransferase DltB (MBOAT superfamily)